MACERDPGPIILNHLNRAGLELACYNVTNNTGVSNGNVSDLDYYLCRLLKNHAYIPAREQKLTHDAMMVYTNNIIALLGIVLNILTICVLARERRYSPSIFLLQCLSVVDTLFLLLNLLNFGIPTLILAVEGVTCSINPYLALKLNAYRSSIVVGKIMNQLSQSMRVMAVGMMVLVTTDRCLAIFYPLQAKRFCTFTAAKTEVFALSVYTFIWFMVFNILDYVDKDYVHKFRAFAVSSIVNLIIPAAIVFVLNLRLIKTLHVSKRMRATMDASANGGRSAQQSFEYASLTAKLVAIASTFSICVVPSIIIAVNWMLTSNLGRNCCLTVDTISKVNLVAILAMNFNSSVNFFFYIMMGWRFRRAFYEMMCGLCLKDYRSDVAMKNAGMSMASKTQTTTLIHRGSTTNIEMNHLRRSSETSARYTRCT